METKLRFVVDKLAKETIVILKCNNREFLTATTKELMDDDYLIELYKVEKVEFSPMFCTIHVKSAKNG